MHIILALSLLITLAVSALSIVAVLTEFDSEIGFYELKAPFHTASGVLSLVAVAGFAAASFSFKRREYPTVLNGEIAVFRFFSSLAACLSLLEAYVRFITYRANATNTDPLIQRGNTFTLLTMVLSLASFFVFLWYAFGKNDGRNPGRANYSFCIVGMLVLRLMESHFTWTVQMNNPMKLAQQISLIVASFAVIALGKCELSVHEAPKKMRVFTLAVTPIFLLPFALTVFVGYYTKTYTSFPLLADGLLLAAICGFVMSSYMPVKRSEEILEREWSEYDERLEEYKREESGEAVPEYEEKIPEDEENAAEEAEASDEAESEPGELPESEQAGSECEKGEDK